MLVDVSAQLAAGLVALGVSSEMVSARSLERQSQTPVVFVDVSPPLQDGHESELLQSCSGVFGEPEYLACRKKSDADQEREVRIRWEETSAEFDVIIEFRRSEGQGNVLRVLSFDPASNPIERWRSVGLVVAALISSEMVHEARRDQDSPPEQPETIAQDLPIEVARRGLYFHTGGLLRQDVSSGHLAGGGSMRGTLITGYAWEPTLSFGALAAMEPAAQLVLRQSLGVALRLHAEPMRVSFRMEALALVTRWSASSGDSSEHAWHGRFGAAVGPTLDLFVSPRLGFAFSVMGTATFPGVHVQVRDQRVGSSSPFAVESSAGLVARF